MPRGRPGFTIPDLVVSMTVLSVVLAGATLTMLRMQQHYTAQRGTVEARETIRALELLLARLLRTSGANPRNLPPAEVQMVVNPLGLPGTSWNNVDLRADFNPVDGALTGHFENARVALIADTVYVRISDGGPLEPVAFPVSELRFQFYGADSTEIADAAAAATARRVKITIGVPVKKSSTTLRRESWVSLRN